MWKWVWKIVKWILVSLIWEAVCGGNLKQGDCRYKEQLFLL